MEPPLPLRNQDEPLNSSKEELYEAKLEELMDCPEQAIGPKTITDKIEMAKYRDVSYKPVIEKRTWQADNEDDSEGEGTLQSE